MCDEEPIKFYISVDKIEVKCPDASGFPILHITEERCYLLFSLKKNIWFTVGFWALIIVSVLFGITILGCGILFIAGRYLASKSSNDHQNDIY